MATNRQTIDETIVRIRPDKAAAAAVIREVNKVKSSVRGIATEGDRALDRRFSQSARAATREVRALNNELDKTQRNAAKAGKAATGLQAAGRDIRNLPSVRIPGVGVGTDTVGRGLEVAGRLGVSVNALATAAPIAALGIGALTAAVIAFKDNFESTKQRIAETLSAENKFIELRLSGTKEAIEGQLESLRLSQRIAQEQLAFQAARFSQELQPVLDAGIGTFARALVAELNPAFGATREAALAARDNLNKVNLELEVYERVLGDSSFTTRAAIDAERALANERQALIETTRLQASIQATRLNAAAIQERIDALDKEREVIQQAIADGVVTGQQADEARNRITAIGAELLSLFTALPQAQELQRQTEAQEAAKKSVQALIAPLFNLSDTVKKLAGNVQEVQAAGRAIQEAREQLNEKLAQIDQRRTEAERRALEDRNNAIDDAEQSASDARADLRLDREDAERQHQENINRIVRRANASIANAIQSRNAVAAAAAIAARKDELTDEQQAFAERQRELKRQADEIDRNLKRQTAIIERRYTQQLHTASIAAEQAVRVEQQRHQAELAIKTQALQQLLNIDVAGEQQRVNVTASAASQKLSIERQYWQASLDLAANAVRQIFGANAQRAQLPQQYQGNSPARRIPTMFHNEGLVTQTGMALVKKGEVVIDPSKRTTGNGLSININGMGMTPRQVGREVERQLEDYTRGMQENNA